VKPETFQGLKWGFGTKGDSNSFEGEFEAEERRLNGALRRDDITGMEDPKKGIGF
jgi:hypothetical protein